MKSIDLMKQEHQNILVLLDCMQMPAVISWTDVRWKNPTSAT